MKKDIEEDPAIVVFCILLLNHDMDLEKREKKLEKDYHLQM